MSQNSSIVIDTRLRVGQPMNLGSVFCSMSVSLFLCLLGPIYLLLNGYWELLPWGVKRPVREAYHSSLSSATGYIFSPSLAYMVCIPATLPFSLPLTL